MTIEHTSCAEVRDGHQEGPICADCLQETTETLEQVVSIVWEQWASEHRAIRRQVTQGP